jgi:cytochrome c553
MNNGMRKIHGIISSFFILCSICLLTSCGRGTNSSQSTDVLPLGAVNTHQVIQEKDSQEPAANAEQVSTNNQSAAQTPDPMAYMYTVDSSEAFDIINSMTPRCTACHRISTKGNSNGPGPNLNGLKDHADSRVPGLSAREYVKQSIIDPGAFIVEECPKSKCVDVMYKKYHEKISSEDLEKLVNYLLTLNAEPTYGDNDEDDEDDEDDDDEESEQDDEDDDDE